MSHHLFYYQQQEAEKSILQDYIIIYKPLGINYTKGLLLCLITGQYNLLPKNKNRIR